LPVRQGGVGTGGRGFAPAADARKDVYGDAPACAARDAVPEMSPPNLQPAIA